MELTLPDSERVLLEQAQRACRGQAGYVPVMVLLMLDQGHAAATVAQALGVNVSSVYRYAQSYQLQGLAGYLRAEQSGYWGLLTSAQLAGLCRQLGQQMYTDCRAIADWLAATSGCKLRPKVSLSKIERTCNVPLRSCLGSGRRDNFTEQ